MIPIKNLFTTSDTNHNPANLQTPEQKVMHLFLSELMKSANVQNLFERMGEAGRKYNLNIDEKIMAQVLTRVMSAAPAYPYDPKGILTSKKIHPVLAKKITTLAEAAWKSGYKIRVWEGYRSPERQDELSRLKNVTNAKAGQSFHNYGLAVDIVFLDDKGQPSWDQSHNWLALGLMAESLGLTWGGRFKSIKDLGHFEYHPGLKIKDVQRLFESGGLKRVWENVL